MFTRRAPAERPGQVDLSRMANAWGDDPPDAPLTEQAGSEAALHAGKDTISPTTLAPDMSKQQEWVALDKGKYRTPVLPGY
jgi:hypothetical protein